MHLSSLMLINYPLFVPMTVPDESKDAGSAADV
jgi:hypothetical protein